MGKKSKTKGKAGELDLVHWLKAHDIYAERGAQHKGGPGSPDVVVPDWPWLHIEVKRTESIDLGSAALELAWNQARHDSRPDQVPVVFWRQSRRPWAMTWRVDEVLATVCGRECVELLQHWAEERK